MDRILNPSFMLSNNSAYFFAFITIFSLSPNEHTTTIILIIKPSNMPGNNGINFIFFPEKTAITSVSDCLKNASRFSYTLHTSLFLSPKYLYSVLFEIAALSATSSKLTGKYRCSLNNDSAAESIGSSNLYLLFYR